MQEKDEIFYLGRSYTFERVLAMSKYYEIDDDKLLIRSGVNLCADRHIFYKDRANFIILPRLITLAKKFELKYTKGSIRNTKRRWGSCSSKGAISLSERLIMAPLFVIDSVILHELAHTKVMNHSSNFYALLYSICPNYKEAEKWLKENNKKLFYEG